MEKLQARDTEQNFEQLTKRIRKVYPNKSICIELALWNHNHMDGIDIKYRISLVGHLVGDKNNCDIQYLNSFSEVVNWIDNEEKNRNDNEILFRRF